MDYNNQDQNPYNTQNPYDIKGQNGYGNAPQYGQNQEKPAGSGMAMAALLVSIGAVSTFWSVYLPFIFGSIAIILALLSKGSEKKMLTQAKTAIGCSIGGFVITIAVIISSLTFLISNPSILVEYGKQYDQVCEQIYGQSTEDIMGFSYEDMMSEYAEAIQNMK